MYIYICIYEDMYVYIYAIMCIYVRILCVCIYIYIHITCEFYIGVNDLPVFTTAHRSHPFLVDNPSPLLDIINQSYQPLLSTNQTTNSLPPQPASPPTGLGTANQPSSGAPLKTLPQNLR